jgi:hypothetical protein
MQIDRAREAVTDRPVAGFAPTSFWSQKTLVKREQSRRDRDLSAGPRREYSTDVAGGTCARRSSFGARRGSSPGAAHRVATREVAGVGSGGTTPRTLHARTPRMG